MKDVYILDIDKPIKIVMEGPKLTESEVNKKLIELFADIPLIYPATSDEISQAIKKLKKE